MWDCRPWACFFGRARGALLLFDGGVYSFGDLFEDVVYGAVAVDSAVEAEVGVVVAEGFGLILIYFEATLDGLEVVVGTTCLAAALEHAVDEFLFLYFEADYGVYLSAAFLEEFLKGLSLGYGAGEAVEDYAVLSGGLLVEHICQNLNHDVVGDELTFADIFVGETAEVGVAGDVVAEHFAC